MAASGLITILFTDLVGSTELASEVGDAAADEQVEPFDTRLAAQLGELMVAYPGAADSPIEATAHARRSRRDMRSRWEPKSASPARGCRPARRVAPRVASLNRERP